jgi:hypothetical protein
MAAKDVEKRRKIRKLEAMRDDHMTKLVTTRVNLAKIRTELKHARKG